MRRRVNRSPKLKSLAKVVGIVLVIGLSMWVYRHVFVINSVKCQLQENPCPDEFANQLQSLVGKSLVKLDTKAWVNQLLAHNYAYASVEMHPYLPAGIAVTVTPAEELAQAANSSESANWIVVTDTGMVTQIVSASSSALPMIIDPLLPAASVGEKVPDGPFLKGLQTLSVMKKNYVPVTTMTLVGENIQLTHPQGMIILVNPNKDVLKQISAIQLILQKHFEQPVTVIDVRFDKPVIQFFDPNPPTPTPVATTSASPIP